jgi:Arc/MetJ-type ribon-helix-helix transcriptional regulator
MAKTSIMVTMTEREIEDIDRLIESGVYRSRADALRLEYIKARGDKINGSD